MWVVVRHRHGQQSLVSERGHKTSEGARAWVKRQYEVLDRRGVFDSGVISVPKPTYTITQVLEEGGTG